jgi:hypothetical protein
VDNNGFTYNLNTLRFNTSSKGFMVSLEKPTVKIPLDTLTLDVFKTSFALFLGCAPLNSKIIHKEPLNIGGWIDQGYVYLDVSIWKREYSEALYLAVQNRQLAIYDLNNNESHYLKNLSNIC